MNAFLLRLLAACLFALVIVATSVSATETITSNEVQRSAVASRLNVGPAPLVAHWTDALNNRARMVQAAFIFILVGIFVLRR